MTQAYLRNRYYDPSIGRFTTEDPVKDGDNWYAYCGNNPVNYIDPWGLAVTDSDKIARAAGLLSDDDIRRIEYYTNAYENAQKNNNYVAMNTAHIAVAQIRTKYDAKYAYNDNYDYSHGGKLFSPYGNDNDTVKDEGWMIIAGAVGGTAIAKGGALAAKASTILAPSIPAIGQISQQTQNHIMQSQHEWGKVV